MIKKHKQRGYIFSENRGFGVMKNKKIKQIYRYPKKLLGFKNYGKPTFI